MLLTSHISACAPCFAGKVCSPVRSTWGTSLGDDKLVARARILKTKVAHQARAGQTFPPKSKKGGRGNVAHRDLWEDTRRLVDSMGNLLSIQRVPSQLGIFSNEQGDKLVEEGRCSHVAHTVEWAQKLAQSKLKY